MADFYNDKVRELFGLDYLYPWQRLVIGNILEGAGYFGGERQEEAPRKNLVILPTGAGKSLCFLMPALLMEGVTLILYPLLALMNDQARRLREGGYEPALFRGGQTGEERGKLWKSLEEGKCRFILTNPETAGTEEFRLELEKIPLSHLVIDEAHTVPLWGETFRGGLLAAGELAGTGLFPVVTAFTATASPSLQEEIGRLIFRGEPFHRIMANPDRANISYHVLYTLFPDPALEELCRREEKPLLIFCRTRAGTEETARYLDRRLGGYRGIARVRFYHAGLGREEKRETEEWFMNDRSGILCATSAYGMGVDNRAVNTVIHRDIPPSVEAYIQEAGRAGRGGGEARALLLAVPREIGEEDGPMERYVFERGQCRRTMLMAALGWVSDYCGGCDHCTPAAFLPRSEEHAASLNQLFRIYNGVFTRGEWTDFLMGRGDSFVRSLRGFALLAGWEKECIGEMLDLCLERRILRIPRHGLGKNRIYVKGLL